MGTGILRNFCHLKLTNAKRPHSGRLFRAVLLLLGLTCGTRFQLRHSARPLLRLITGHVPRTTGIHNNNLTNVSRGTNILITSRNPTCTMTLRPHLFGRHPNGIPHQALGRTANQKVFRQLLFPTTLRRLPRTDNSNNTIPKDRSSNHLNRGMTPLRRVNVTVARIRLESEWHRRVPLKHRHHRHL